MRLICNILVDIFFVRIGFIIANFQTDISRFQNNNFPVFELLLKATKVNIKYINFLITDQFHLPQRLLK